MSLDIDQIHEEVINEINNNNFLIFSPPAGIGKKILIKRYLSSITGSVIIGSDRMVSIAEWKNIIETKNNLKIGLLYKLPDVIECDIFIADIYSICSHSLRNKRITCNKIIIFIPTFSKNFNKISPNIFPKDIRKILVDVFGEDIIEGNSGLYEIIK